ncbi:hypothetical protein [Ensifer soli]|uniref:hypothetical protein n=1 Tax=Ciceribacter sp. sgz301302 TaxID=3342379 RepID=UPI0035B81B8D
MVHARSFRLMLAGVAFACLGSNAFALDGADVVAKFNAANAVSGATVGYGSVDVSGSTVTLKGAKVTMTGQPEALEIGDVTLSGVSETAGGGYRIETVALPDVDKAKDGMRVTVGDIVFGGVTVPAQATNASLDTMLLYDRTSTGPIRVTVKDREVFSATGTTATMSRQASGNGVDFDAALSGIKADLSGVEDPKAKDAIQKLGLQTLSGKVTAKGSWELDSGTIALDEYAFDFADVGRLNLELAISGYTLKFVQALQDAVKAAEANPNKEQANQAMGLAMMGLMQQLTFNGAAIRFDDASLTKRVLDYVGGQQGVSGDQLAQSLKGLVPIMIAQLQLPELQNQLTTAANAYLDQPKSLTVRAAPPSPVPFPMIAGAAMGAPRTLPGVLGVTVTAND